MTEFKKQTKNDMHQVENDIFKMLERKANVLDVSEALNQKADHALVQNMP